MVILVMGVAGSGKTTIGQRLAEDLGWTFIDADDVHPPANIKKMSAGQPLNDEDRAPWLAALRQRIEECIARGENAVVTCSALKEHYRNIIVVEPEKVKIVHLHGSPELLRSRISGRKGHFMSPAMLDSQLAALEPPRNALELDVAQTPPELVTRIRQEFCV
ncbi:MAG TPA: gluconokinase [Opitutus sp.]|nr:gluconokinase [Opitutus sp.]